MITHDERLAIASLERLARRWPKTLCLIKHGDSTGISVKHVADCGDDPGNAHSLAIIEIKSDACA